MVIKSAVNVLVNHTWGRYTPEDGGGQEARRTMIEMVPWLPVRDKYGKYTTNLTSQSENSYFGLEGMSNPVMILDLQKRMRYNTQIFGNAALTFHLADGLDLKTQFGVDSHNTTYRGYSSIELNNISMPNGWAEYQNWNTFYWQEETYLTYNKVFGDHRLNAMAGLSWQERTQRWDKSYTQGFSDDFYENNNMSVGTLPNAPESSWTRWAMNSYFLRFAYTYKDRYLVTATLRADGASNFAKNNRWGYFPSVALGWRFTEENFARSLNLDKVLSNGKLRLSYGQTGNSNIGDKSVTYYGTGYNKVFGNKEYTGVYVSQIGNPDLKWETTTEWNVGLDLGFLNNRFNVTAEYFHKVVSDLLSSRSVLSYNEVGSIAANIGKTQSQGFELTINTKNFDTKDFSWNTDFTFSFYRDKWKERDENWSPNPYDMYNAPLRGYYMYLSDGLIQPGEEVSWMPGALPGQVKLKDIDGYAYNEDGTYKTDKHGIPLRTGKPDGKIDYADAVFKGCSDPGYLLGLNNTFRYKNFDLNVYFYGQLDLLKSGSYKDYWIVGSGTMTGVNNLYRGYNMPTSAKEVWSHDNTSGKMPGYFQYMSNYGYGDYFLEKSWFIRCRNITLGYTLPVKSAKKLVSNVRIYADVNNLFTITPYDGLDVETDDSYWAYPNVRSFSIGLDINF